MSLIWDKNETLKTKILQMDPWMLQKGENLLVTSLIFTHMYVHVDYRPSTVLQ